MNAVQKLGTFGQSVWYDNVSRSLIRDGGLADLIASGIVGVTSNPAIFEKAIGQSHIYDEAIRACSHNSDAQAVFRQLAVEDLKAACDLMRPVYDKTGGRDGYVSIEVSPYLAHDGEGTIAEARSLWQEIGRQNLLVKVPATAEGVSAIRTLIADGININVTLLFARQMYEKVAQAYLSGLEARPKSEDLSKIASVASFFVSRIDSKVDGLIAQKLKTAGGAAVARLAALKGKAAIANAKLAYALYKRIFSGPRWQALQARGARPQRMLWASTGTKEKSYSDVLYVEALIGPDTVNTMPPETVAAYLDHGNPQSRLEDNLSDAEGELAALEAAGISLDAVTAELLQEGIKKFQDAADTLFAAINTKRGT